MTEMINVFEMERLIIDRLRERLPDLKTVCDLSAIQSAVSITEHLPAAFLVDGGAEASEKVTRVSNRIIEDQVWIVVVTTTFMRDGDRYPVWLEGTGEILSRVYQALHDWTAGNGARCSYLKRDEAFYGEGYIECPVHFAASTVFDWPE